MGRKTPQNVPGSYLVEVADRDFDSVRAICEVPWAGRRFNVCHIKANWKQLRQVKRLPNVTIVQRDYIGSFMV